MGLLDRVIAAGINRQALAALRAREVSFAHETADISRYVNLADEFLDAVVR